jgi:GrpB-like predicted nucleotidyltransferase (UPF0157 family)
MCPAITRNATEWSNASEDRIELVDPDPAWPRRYRKEAAALLGVLAPIPGLRLEHFGSTAVPNLRAKPVIDIMLIHPTPEVWLQLVEPFGSLGYVYWADNPRQDQMFFVKGMPPFGSRRTHHVHVRVPQDAERELVFRDLLRADAALAHSYEQLKDDLAKRYPTNRQAYTEGKTAFIAEVLKRYAA